MFAVVEIGGRQYKVVPHEKIQVEKLETEEGKDLNFDKILLISEENGENAKIGQPYIKGASVDAKVVEHFKGDKVIVHKFTAKKRYSKTQGHRQNYTSIEIMAINS